MREMTASEASRNFKGLLDAVEHGESVLLTRGGQRVATVAPAPRANGRALREIIDRWRSETTGREALDATFAQHVADASSQAAADADLDSDPWRG